MPLASGQSRAIKEQVNKGDTGLSNRKWSYRRIKEEKGRWNWRRITELEEDQIFGTLLESNATY